MPRVRTGRTAASARLGPNPVAFGEGPVALSPNPVALSEGPVALGPNPVALGEGGIIRESAPDGGEICRKQQISLLLRRRILGRVPIIPISHGEPASEVALLVESAAIVRNAGTSVTSGTSVMHPSLV